MQVCRGAPQAVLEDAQGRDAYGRIDQRELAERLRRRGHEVCLCGGPGDSVGCPAAGRSARDR